MEEEPSNYFNVVYEEGQIVEITNLDYVEIEKKQRVKSTAMIKKLVMANPNLSNKELDTLIEKELDKLQMGFDDVKDALKNRRWGKVSKVKNKKEKYVIEVKKILPKDYNKFIDKIASHIASKLSNKNIVDLLKDTIADSQLKPEKLKKVAKNVDKIKVEAKRGCFNIVLDKDLKIPIRN